MIASLPMYDWPEVRAETDKFWVLIRDAFRDAGIPAPDQLSRTAEISQQWHADDLLLSQTCGLPYRLRLHDKVKLVGVPDHRLPDTLPGHYYSVVIVRAAVAGDLQDFRNAKLAYNAGDSQSGWAAPQLLATAHGFQFQNTVSSGAHRDSARAVATGHADIAALDVNSWHLVQRFMPEIAGRLRVLTNTAATPALPYICAPMHSATLASGAIRSAIVALDRPSREALGIHGIVPIKDDEYLRLPTPVFMQPGLAN